MPDWTEVEGEGLAAPAIAAGATGEGVTVAIVDSGVRFDHPHLGLPAWGFGIDREEDYVDQYGHGTCCAALVHFLAPAARILAVRVTGVDGTTDAAHLARGIVRAAEAGADIVAVALGTEIGPRRLLDDAVASALARDALVVAADPRHGRRVLPAQSAGAIGVGHKDGVDVAQSADGRVVAEGRARPLDFGGRNFWGSSLSTARVAAALARLSETTKARGEGLRRGFKKALIVL